MRPSAALVLAFTLGCLTSANVVIPADTADLPTIDGPEAEGLIKELKGQLVYPEPVGGILAIVLPSLEKKTVRPAGQHPAVSDLSGPDHEGRVAVVEAPLGKGTILSLIRTDGSREMQLLQRPSGGPRSRAIGRPSLAPVGGYVAFVAKTQSLIMEVDPKTHFHEGMLEVWQAKEQRRVKEIDTKALDRSLAWFPDGKSLVYSALVGPEIFDRLIDGYTAATGASGLIPVVDLRVPVVHQVNVSGEKAKPLCIGRRSVVSTDGKAILVQGIGFEWMLLDVSNGKLSTAKLPGLYDRDRLGIYEGGAIALLGNDLVIYWGLPTKGSIQRTTRNNSPLVGEKKMPSIKAARLSSGEFQTIIPSMDQRREVLFGGVSN